MVKVERSVWQEPRDSESTQPNRSLFYLKIAKGERRGKFENPIFKFDSAEPPPILFKDTNFILSTICAPATAPGGAISVIRTSGAAAISITDNLFCPASGNALSKRRGGSLAYGHIVDSATGETVDEVLVSLFRAPHSYTGEDATEISCHGSAYVVSRIMELLVRNGCRLAQPGEFTKRAFLNGKMDLSQAEAVADVIASTTAASHRLAMNQLRGGFGKELSDLREKLLHLTTLLELELDFSDHEDLEFAERGELSALALDVERRLDELTCSFRVGNAIKHGVPVAIVGQTNAGKSTLLNALLHEDKAIVSDIHGTTRDVIEDTFTLSGVLFRLIDTAGLRSTTDRIESLGIDRSLQKIEQSDIILWLIDATDASCSALSLAPEILSRVKSKRLLIVFNKTERAGDWPGASLDAGASSGASLDTGVSSNVSSNASLDALPDAKSQPNGAHATLSENSVSLFDEALCNHAKSAYSSLLHQLPEDTPCIFISARSGLGLDKLEEQLVNAAAMPSVSQADIIVTNERHHAALAAALADIRRAREAMSVGLSGDLVSEDLRACINHLGEILAQGTISPEETLQNVFKGFCIGK